nr:PREDICTED: alpha-crystallin B chain-like [Linepithema humile]
MSRSSQDLPSHSVDLEDAKSCTDSKDTSNQNFDEQLRRQISLKPPEQVNKIYSGHGTFGAPNSKQRRMLFAHLSPAIPDLKSIFDERVKKFLHKPPIHKDPIHKDPIHKDFQLILDVQYFEPHEIKVKVVNNYLVVTAKHEDKQDEHGLVSRQFTRRCELPENCNIEQLTSKLSSDGILTIASKQPPKDKIEKTVRIECTGKPFIY